MKHERYQQIEELYHAALGLKPEARSAYLERASGGDEALRDEVKSLLAAHEQVGDYFKAPALEVAAAMLAAEQPHAMVGRRLGHYRVVSLLGAGGMGEVFLAEDTRLGRKVAIKILSHNFIHDEKLIRRFKQEARAVSALNHPNILTLFDIGEDNSTLFIATEYVQGITLRQRLSGGKLVLDEAIDIATQTAHALAAAHHAGIIHRDIKPENIMLRDDGYVKVLDFGLAKLSEPKALSQDSSFPTSPLLSTEPGLVMGTTQYMSPEQVRGLEVDPRTDIFSLGVVLYEMIAGVNPFAGATVSDTIAAILEREPQPLSYYAPDCPVPLQQIILKAVNKDADHRYQTAKDFLEGIKTVPLEAVLIDPSSYPSTLRFGGSQALSNTPNRDASTVVVDEAVNTDPNHPEKTTEVEQPLTYTPEPIPNRSIDTKLPKRKWRYLLIVAAVLSIVFSIGLIFWLLTNAQRRNTLVEQVTDSPSQTVVSGFQLNYSTLVKKKKGAPFQMRPQVNRQSSGELVIDNKILLQVADQFKLVISSPNSGYLYVIYEAQERDPNGKRKFMMLFPASSETAFIKPNEILRIPRRDDIWYELDSTSETIWLIWSTQRIPGLEETKQFNNAEIPGQITDSDYVDIIWEVLKKYRYSAPEPQIEIDEANAQIKITGKSDVFIHLVQFGLVD